ncbi:hypothetical protein PoB_005521800 [Plakobranchus ocellatus]|uniref:Uncharacterized protein n=1 Tax=Plakobranchus ocellatus TaxID=259542 RepID=A0AAV4CB41_9GAST|nr:hypothetical protein PoB_005521800 [Plakobranchus ocellatus]
MGRVLAMVNGDDGVGGGDSGGGADGSERRSYGWRRSKGSLVVSENRRAVMKKMNNGISATGGVETNLGDQGTRLLSGHGVKTKAARRLSSERPQAKVPVPHNLLAIIRTVIMFSGTLRMRPEGSNFHNESLGVSWSCAVSI